MQIEREQKATRDELIEQTALYLYRKEINAGIERGEADIAAGRVTESDATWAEVFASIKKQPCVAVAPR